MNTHVQQHWKEYITRAFYLDVRSLGLFRIFLGLSTFVFIIKVILVAHLVLTPDGFIPIELLQNYPQRWSFHFMSPAMWWQYTLLFTIAITSLLYAAGWHSKFLAFVLWLLMLSLFIRCKLIFNTGQKCMFYLFMWSMFLPIDKAFIVQGTWGKWSFTIPKGKHTQYLSIETVGFIWQLLLMFWVSIYFKKANPAWMDGTAVYMALHHDVYTSRVAPLIRDIWPVWTIPATYFAVIQEFLGPLLLIIPWKHNWCRSIGLISTAGLGFMFMLLLDLGTFPIIIITAFIPTIPSVWWEYLISKRASWKKKATTLPIFKRHFVSKVLVSIVIVVVTWGNLYNMEPKIFPIPYSIRSMFFSPFYGIQNWGVYIQKRWYTHWMLIDAETQSGRHVDAWRWWSEEALFDFNLEHRPKSFPQHFESAFWRNYMYFNIQFKDDVRRWFLFNMCKQYNAAHPDDKALSMMLYLRSEEILGIQSFAPIETKSLLQYTCP